DRLHARPGEAVAADADAIADGTALTEHVIEMGVRRIDDDGAGRLGAVVGDHLAPEALIDGSGLWFGNDVLRRDLRGRFADHLLEQRAERKAGVVNRKR